jgi:hypothetical protein
MKQRHAAAVGAEGSIMEKTSKNKSKAAPTVDLRKIYRSTQKESRGLLEAKFRALAERRRAENEGIGKAAKAGAAALGRLLARDEEYAAAIRLLVAASHEELVTLEKGAPKHGRPLSRDLVMGILSSSGIREFNTRDGHMTMTMAKDVTVDVRFAPYDDFFMQADGGRHQQQQVFADKNTGEFGFLFTIGKEGGAVSCGAGVEVLFMRQQPGSPAGQGTTGSAQVRTYTPYEYSWRNLSYGGTAHQHAGFGILVWSASINGGPSRTDLDHQNWSWNDGSSWTDDHKNPSYPGHDSDNALQSGNEAPYFPIEPGRIYGAWIWCFASADAHGADLTSAAFAQGLIQATAKLVVIGQQ